MTKDEQSFTFSSFDDRTALNCDDQDLFLDMDVAFPFQWDNASNTGDSSSSSQEFDFGMALLPSDSSPADHLFYKGQLLPLHLPPRLQMVEHLSSPHTGYDGDGHSLITFPCFLQSDDSETCITVGTHRNNTDFSLSHCMYPDGSGNDSWGFEVGSAADGVQRDSEKKFLDFCSENNQGMQDAFVFPSCYRDDPTLYCKHSVEVYVDQQEKMHSSGLLRWKLLWPVLKKGTKSGLEERRGSNDCRTKSTETKEEKWLTSKLGFGILGMQKGLGKEQKAAESQKQIDSWNSLESEKDRVMNKARKYLQRCLEVLKPAARSFLSKKFARTGSLYEKHVDMGGTQRPIHKSFQSGRLEFEEIQVNATLSRRSDGSISNRVTDCGNCSSRRMSPSTFEELHSAIQGAIAHCKQSQAVGK